jgi:hypothetical protein
MINARELRIGNCLQRLDGSTFQVTIHDLHTIHTWTGSERLLPSGIPLFEEWLKKLNFTQEGTLLFFSSDYRWLVQKHKTKWSLFKHTSYDTIYIAETEFVHHFQNLYFALTETELTITP